MSPDLSLNFDLAVAIFNFSETEKTEKTPTKSGLKERFGGEKLLGATTTGSTVWIWYFPATFATKVSSVFADVRS